ncbi:MAG: alpha-ribazole kinase [Clostridia bacterium]|nr:alpha-ribazole kinase [Clostridia bacterium]MDR3645228.1 alpha-ribazole kinase [Clostridia bacterium]
MSRLTSPRDVIFMETPGGILVMAVDSCGSIGLLPNDTLRVDPEIAGRFTARVALLEVLAVGARPMFASVAIACGPQTAEPLLTGVRSVLGADFPLIVSTEKNMPTSMTAFGVTVTGFCEPGKLRTGCAERGDVLYCAGVPLVGIQTLEPGARLFDEAALRSLFDDSRVHAVIPAGSRGVAAEARVLAEESGFTARLDPQAGVDLLQSAGPSSCAVFAAPPCARFEVSLPVTEIGTLI